MIKYNIIKLYVRHECENTPHAQNNVKMQTIVKFASNLTANIRIMLAIRHYLI